MSRPIQIWDTPSEVISEGIVFDTWLEEDDMTTPDMFDCYDEETIAAWERNDWGYVGVCSEIRVGGEVWSADSIWGVEFPLGDHRALIEEYRKEMRERLIDTLADYEEVMFRRVELVKKFLQRPLHPEPQVEPGC